MVNVYDAVRYPSLPIAHSHPAALGAFAQLFGKPHAPFPASRVLEIGCGEGANLVGMAVGAPDAEFVGIDLAEGPIAAARAAAQGAGLGNVRFQVADIAGIEASLGRFDYIIAHGVYAWTPAAVRAAVMRVAGELLSADGVAFISYNALPGSRFGQALRDMLLFAMKGVDDPRERLGIVRPILAEQIENWSDDDPDERAMKFHARRMLNRTPEGLYHDELNDDFAPQLLSDVGGRAASRVGLEYLCDAQPHMCEEALFPSAKLEALRARAAGDWVRFEQLWDFRNASSFRNSIFCRRGGIDRAREPSRLRGLWASADLRLLPADSATPGSTSFAASDGVKITTNDPKLAQFLSSLAAAYPASVSLDEAAENAGLAEYALHLFVKRVVRLRTAPFALTATPGERPVASPLARYQAANDASMLTTLHHAPTPLENGATRAFLCLLDGTRTRDDLARELIARDKVSASSAAEWVADTLTRLTRAGLMMG